MVAEYFEDKKSYDAYVHGELGVFIPITDDRCALSPEYSYPCYEVIVDFNLSSETARHYRASITSPDVVHRRRGCRHCYILLIGREYFEQRYLLYAEAVPECREFEFDFCSDILKALNTFVFEVSKSMPNSDITLAAQEEIIAHWTIRSLMGETQDTRAVSSDYSLARAQHYIEQHYAEAITLDTLAKIGHMSVSTFTRHFRKEFGISPIEYLIDVRLKTAKLLLKRRDISVTEAALRSGFGSASHFSTCFAERVGTTPQEYRRRFIE